MGPPLLRIIETWEQYSLGLMLFVDGNTEVNADTEVVLVPFIDGSSRGPVGTRYYLGIEAIRDVLSALEDEGIRPTPEQKFRAVNYYAENDAFIDAAELK